jgi:hypothetical protein
MPKRKQPPSDEKNGNTAGDSSWVSSVSKRMKDEHRINGPAIWFQNLPFSEERANRIYRGINKLLEGEVSRMTPDEVKTFQTNVTSNLDNSIQVKIYEARIQEDGEPESGGVSEVLTCRVLRNISWTGKWSTGATFGDAFHVFPTDSHVKLDELVFQTKQEFDAFIVAKTDEPSESHGPSGRSGSSFIKYVDDLNLDVLNGETEGMSSLELSELYIVAHLMKLNQCTCT